MAVDSELAVVIRVFKVCAQCKGHEEGPFPGMTMPFAIPHPNPLATFLPMNIVVVSRVVWLPYCSHEANSK